mmetsp:Transcript_4678/g.8963  ORF Transcript_4678/g.8963 Transcript_4678/m.8963 type:complete len:202 (-) Transcript_4678:1096-1701(-)
MLPELLWLSSSVLSSESLSSEDEEESLSSSLLSGSLSLERIIFFFIFRSVSWECVLSFCFLPDVLRLWSLPFFGLASASTSSSMLRLVLCSTPPSFMELDVFSFSKGAADLDTGILSEFLLFLVVLLVFTPSVLRAPSSSSVPFSLTDLRPGLDSFASTFVSVPVLSGRTLNTKPISFNFSNLSLDNELNCPFMRKVYCRR